MIDIESTTVEIHTPLPFGRTDVFCKTFKSLRNAIYFVREHMRPGVFPILRGPSRYLDERETAELFALGLVRI
jgi:hypothetical protein